MIVGTMQLGGAVYIGSDRCQEDRVNVRRTIRYPHWVQTWKVQGRHS